MSAVRYLPLEEIRRRPDARSLDETIVAGLADSINEVGLRCPINVRLIGEEYELIAGAHRLAAYERLGETEILVIEVVEDDLHAELAMIDENLCRSELSPVDRARQTARRKAIYEELHPETRLGENQHTRVRQLGEASGVTQRFTADTAAKTGQSERTAQRDAERGEKIIPDVLEMVKGTQLESGAYLDALKNLTPNDQVATARQDLAVRRRVGSGARGSAAQVKGTSAAKAQPDLHQRLIRLLDEVSSISPPDIISACPARERAALASRLSHLIDRFSELLREIAP